MFHQMWEKTHNKRMSEDLSHVACVPMGKQRNNTFTFLFLLMCGKNLAYYCMTNQYCGLEPFSSNPSWLETRWILMVMVLEWVIDECFLVPLRLRLSLHVSREHQVHTTFDTVWLDTAISWRNNACGNYMCSLRQSVCHEQVHTLYFQEECRCWADSVSWSLFFYWLNSDTVAVHLTWRVTVFLDAHCRNVKYYTA